ncbi:MAG: glycosyltransferase [Lysobacter sp.]|nr:MAG: glycosyltransferase [Lysobacter sp.]
MITSWADIRFLSVRMAGLVRRGMASLRERGFKATFERLLARLGRRGVAPGTRPWLPAEAPFAPFSIGMAAAPVASIIIPVYNQFAHTLACLRALAAHSPAAPVEVIVVDDGSSDETALRLPDIAGVVYVRRECNGGFIAACNDGAARARGRFVVFLNNDTVPQSGWLDALLGTFDAFPDTGLAGARLIYPDGRLQEAGGLVFSDASGWNYGRFGTAEDPRYSYVRATDYCSGAAIALPRDLFARLGGFDIRYAPAYYEDTDIAFAVRASGHAVRYQPASIVVHCEGATAGTDTGSGIKAYQRRNQTVFADKWARALVDQPAPGTPADQAVVRAQRQVLVIDSLTPDETRDSGSLRIINLMRLLIEEGAHVVFLAANREHTGTPTRRLQQLGVEVWYAPHAQRPPSWLQRHGARFDTIVVCRHYVMREFLPLLRQHAPQARIVFDTVDLHYLREQRGAELSGDPSMRRAATRTRSLELDVIAGSDVTLVVSDVERALLARDAPGARVEILSNLHHAAGPGKPFDARRDMVFVGGFRHPPNTDAVLWFARDVWPRIRAELPGVRFACIGADPPAEVRELAALPGIDVHGHVPDIAPFMEGARVAVAPLRYGAGVKGKVNLSMAHGQPVVATSCAVEGMHLTDGVDVLVADDAQAFADAVVRAYTDAGLWERLAGNGLDSVRRHFSPDAARDVCCRVFFDRG